ncbi:MAG TPA: hypothetical protein VGJ97_07715 [Anaerolineaceae bacterium]
MVSAPTETPVFQIAAQPVSLSPTLPAQASAVNPIPTITPSSAPLPLSNSATLVPEGAAHTAVPLSPTSTSPAFLPALDFLPASLPALPAHPPLAPVHIVRPGPGSRVTTPVVIQVSAIPGADRAVTLELVGEDGRIIAAEIQRFSTPLGQRVGLLANLDFKLAGVAEAARLQVTTRDARGRLSALDSVSLVLLSSGAGDFSLEAAPEEHFILLNPTANGVTSGGALPINGYFRPANRQPLNLELINDDSEIIASASLILPAPGPGYYPISGILHYTITTPTYARLTLRQPDSRLPGDAVVTTVLVYLKP